MRYFLKSRYFLGEEALLEREKRVLALKHHPDRWGKASDFVAMMDEFERLKAGLSVREPVREPRRHGTDRYARTARETVRKERDWRDAGLGGTLFALAEKAFGKADGLLSRIPPNVRWFLLFFTATFSLVKGFGVLYVVLVVATLLKKNWFAFFACFLVPVKLFETVGFAPEWFATFAHGIWALPILAALFVPWFVEDDGRTNEERMESIRRSGAKLASWL